MLSLNQAEAKDSVDTPRKDLKTNETAEEEKPSNAMEVEEEKEKKREKEGEAGEGKTKKRRKLTIVETPEENEMSVEASQTPLAIENGTMTEGDGALTETQGASVEEVTEPTQWRKTSTLHVSRDVETETALTDNHESSLTKAVSVVMQEDVLTREGPGKSEEEMVDSATFYLEPDEEEGRPGMTVTASCSINRQQKAGKTIITGEQTDQVHGNLTGVKCVGD